MKPKRRRAPRLKLEPQPIHKDAWWYEGHHGIDVVTFGKIVHIRRAQLVDWVKRTEPRKRRRAIAWPTEAIPWIKRHREIYGSTLKDAAEAWNRTRRRRGKKK